MNNLVKQEGFVATLLTSLTIIFMVLIIEANQNWFVHESGNFKVFRAPGIILAIGLLLKWRYVREILMVINFLSLAGMAIVLTNSSSEFVLNLLLVGLVLVVTFCMLCFSKSIKNYQRKPETRVIV